MIFLYIVLALIAALVLVLFINTAVQTSKARKLVPAKAEHTDDEISYYANRLKQMIQCKTVSVKGSYDDTEFAKLRKTVAELFP
ncbi:MAG: hypothetical protein K2G22_00860, partial [Eubacterium sp.]|nr:hypothetical protein [Eubacterium sp.]